MSFGLRSLDGADRRALAFVALVPAALWLCCWPFADVGVNDDFGYAFVVYRLLETGRFTYNGWCNPMLGAQALWGAAFCAAFGFSHDVLRLSTLPLACACGAMTYALHRRFDVPPRWSAFATLLLVTSPIFTPWSASFMTDVPGLTMTLALLHASLSLTRARTPASVARATALVVLLGAVGGTIRQTNFVFAIVALSLEIVRRRRSVAAIGTLVVAIALEAAYAVALFVWQARQPYATPEGWPTDGTAAHGVLAMSGLALTFVSMLLPLGVAALRLRRRPGRRVALVGVGVACLAVCGGVVWAWPGSAATNFALGLWSGSTLTPTGMLFDGIDAPGERPIVIGIAARVAIAATVYWLLAVAAAALVRRRATIARASRDAFAGPPEAFAALAFVAQGAIYVALLIPRASALLIFDRYLLVLVPACSVALLYALRRRLAATPGIAAWALLTLYAFVGAAIAHDHFAELRLRDRIAADLAREHVPRTAIANGITFDGWTQLVARHYVNDQRIVNPRGAYVRDPNAAARERVYWYLPFTPVVEPRWVIACAPALPATLGDRRVYRFRAILPPRDRVLLAWPLRAAVTTRPARGSTDESTVH